MNATLVTPHDVYINTYRCAHTVADAAKALGVSESTIRRVARSLGVKRIAGRSVSGFVKFDASRLPVVLPFSAK